MTTLLSNPSLFPNVVAWAAQIAIVVAIGALAALCLSPGRARLVFWQVLLAVALLLPALEPWRVPAVASGGTVSVTTSAVAVVAVPHTSPSFVWRKEYILFVILAGAVLRCLWLVVGFVRLRMHRLAARPMAEPPVPFENLAIRWYVSDTVSGPVTFGWLRPAILLPRRVFELPADLREAIACHELIHVRRGDWLFVLAEEVIRGALWFHPAVWFALSQIQLAREQTVDAEVVNLMSNRERYLDALVAVAAQRLYPDVAPAPLFLKKRQLAVRVAAVLKETRMSKARLATSFTAVCSAALAAAGLAVWMFPLQSPVKLNAQVMRVVDSPGIEVEAGGPLMHRISVVRPESVTATGTVILDLSLNSKGDVTDARVMSGPDELRKYALQSVLQWHYSMEAGASPTVRATIKFGAAPPANNLGVTMRKGSGDPAMGPAKIQIFGVSPEVEQKVRARLPVHDGDQVTPESMRGIQAAAREVDEHFTASIGFSKTEALIRLSLGMVPPPPPPPTGGVAGGVLIAGAQIGGVTGGVSGGVTAPEELNTPQRIRVGGNVQTANLLSRVQPVYPPLAKQARIQGVVHLTAIIGRDGTVQHLEVISGHPLMVPAALDAVKQWTYKPTFLNGAPVEVITQVDVNFTLSGEPLQQN
jgi:TonB family protein